jgi:hypothetical protein
MRTTNTLEELTQALKNHAAEKEITRLQRIETLKRLKEIYQEKAERLSLLRREAEEKKGDVDRTKEVLREKERAWSEAVTLFNGESSR